MAPCELKPDGILRKLGICGIRTKSPKFHLIPHIPTNLLTKDFWVNRLKKFFFDQLIEEDKKNGNHNHVHFTLLVCIFHFPESFFEDGQHVKDLFRYPESEIGKSSKRILLMINAYKSAGVSPEVLAGLVREKISDQAKLFEDIFLPDPSTEELQLIEKFDSVEQED